MNRATGGTSWDSKTAGLGALGSSYTYDPNGNLKTVQRQDASAQSVDNLTYTMVASTNNLLDKVVDATTGSASSYTNDLDETQASGNYAYDATGNLTKDVAAGIAANGIVWTPYGKIKQITNATYRIEYLYDAMGNRVRQKRTKLSDNTYVTTYYGRDASGKNVVGTYEKIGTGSTVLKEVPLYGSSRIGILRPNATQSTTAITPLTIYTRSLGRKEYEITDHLGNVRVSISDRLVKPGSDWLNDVKTQTDYFPFGMQREDRNDNVAGYRYGYNGKENDNDVKGEGNQQDYGFRIYDPRVARFLSVDPLTADYPWYTPYQFAGNKPVLALDLDGLEELIYKFRFDQRTSGVQLMTTVDTRPESSRSGNPATVQYQYFDQSGKRLSIRRNYQGRYVAGDNEIMPYHTGNYFGSVYIGPNNPVQADGSPDYRYEPRHVVDADALLHDRAYDFF